MDTLPIHLQQQVYKNIFDGVLHDLKRKTKDFGLYIDTYYKQPYDLGAYSTWFSNLIKEKEYCPHLKRGSKIFQFNTPYMDPIGR